MVSGPPLLISSRNALAVVLTGRGKDGAAGIQAGLTSLDPAYVKNLRAKADEYGMYLELQAPLPKQDTTLFEQHMAAAKELGARCVRSVCLGGRRYETFNTLAERTTRS